MNNLKAARKAKKLTQIEVANAIGLSQSSYSYWENNDAKIESSALSKLADMFGVTVDYLIGASDNPQNSISVPVLGAVPAGIPLEAIEDVLDWEEIPASMCAGGREYFALRVTGDSMWPDYLEDDVVIVRKSPTCESGDVCVVYVNGYDATLKQVKIQEDGSLTLIPKNQSSPPRTFSPQEIRELPVSIAGIVVELRRRIK